MIRSYVLSEEDVREAVAYWLNGTAVRADEPLVDVADVKVAFVPQRGTGSVNAFATQRRGSR